MNNQSWIRHFDSSNQESSLYNIGEWYQFLGEAGCSQYKHWPFVLCT